MASLLWPRCHRLFSPFQTLCHRLPPSSLFTINSANLMNNHSMVGKRKQTAQKNRKHWKLASPLLKEYPRVIPNASPLRLPSAETVSASPGANTITPSMRTASSPGKISSISCARTLATRRRLHRPDMETPTTEPVKDTEKLSGSMRSACSRPRASSVNTI